MRHASALSLVTPFAFVLALASTAALVQSTEHDARADATEHRAIQLPVERTKLANGLDVIYQPDNRTPIVSVNIWYHVGSKDEPQGRNGFAHLFEHLMFQGSKHVPEDHYFKLLERAGGSSINGTTSDDRTNYFETVPSNRLELALWLESDRMGFLLDHVDQATFESQREVVKNERRQNYENAPYGMVLSFIHAALYPVSHPYHLLTIGTPEDLDRASLDDVRAFFRTWYVPNNASLVISGTFDRKAAGDLVEKYFGPIPAAPSLPARNVPGPVSLAAEKHIDVDAGVELSRVYINWPTVPFFAEGDADLDLAARALSSGKSSRLYKRLVYDLQIAQDVAAFQASAQYGSTFSIIATAKPGHTPAELLAVIDEELAKLRAAGITDDELARGKTSITTEELFGIERSSRRADRVNSYVHFTGDPDYLARDIARTENATKETIAAAVRANLPEHGRVVTFVNPKKGAPLSGVIASMRAANGGSK